MRQFFWGSLICLDVLIVLSFVSGYAAAYVHPRTLWFLQALAIGLPYLSISVLLMTVVFAFFGGLKMLAPHLVLCLLIVVRFVPAEWFYSSAAASQDHLTVMTFNAKCRLCGDGDADDTRLMELLEQEGPDLAAFQEVAVWFQGRSPDVTGTPNLKPILHDGQYVTVRPERPHHVHLSQPVFGRASRAGLALNTQTQTALPNEHINSSYTRMSFRWRGREAALYNVHLFSFRSKPWDDSSTHGSFLRRWTAPLRQFRRDIRVQAREAEHIREKLDEETVPVIVVGDFNSTPHSWAFRHLANGYKDAFEAAGDGWGATYHSRLPFVRIDHILVSPEWKIADARTPRTTYSDHLPVVADLWLLPE